MCSSMHAAGEAAKRRVLELEDENRRQRAALKASSSQAAAAQRQLRELASRVGSSGVPACLALVLEDGLVGCSARVLAVSIV